MQKINSRIASQQKLQSLKKLQRETDAKKSFERSNYSLISSEVLESAWNISFDMVQEHLDNGSIFAITDPSRKELYPSFFAETEKYRPDDLMQIIRTLHDVPGNLKYHFFVAKLPRLENRTALQEIENGNLEKVLIAATAFAGPRLP